MVFGIVVIMVIAIAVLLRVSLMYASKITEKMMNGIFKDAEIIINKEAIPESWVKQAKLRKRIYEIFKPNSLNWEEKERDLMIKNLNKLIKYFKKCPFFKDPESRTITLKLLKETGTKWKNNWQELEY